MTEPVGVESMSGLVAGLLVNPLAGGGIASRLDRLTACIRSLPGRVACAPGPLGGDWVRLAGRFPAQEVDLPLRGSRADSVAAARMLGEAGIGFLVVVGGDGTMADAAMGLLESGRTVPIVGIGTGTTNVGPLVAARLDALPPGALAEPNRWVRRTHPAVAAAVDGRLLGLGFNDCVFAFTVPGTVDGRPRNVDVRSRMAGTPVPGTLRPVGKDALQVRLSRGGHTVELTEGFGPVGQVVVAPVDDRYSGKAIAGGACWSMNDGACVLLSDRVLVTVEWPETQPPTPLTCRTVALGPGDRVRITGLVGGTALCVDGTPLTLLEPHTEADLWLEPHAAETLTPPC